MTLLRFSSLVLFIWSSFCCASAQNTGTANVTYDVVIRNGKVVDGSGKPALNADIGIAGDRIAAIGDLKKANAKRVVDAAGMTVSPGFIDMLGQSELALIIDNRALSKLSQGITTEITGEGGSAAPQDSLTLTALQPSIEPYHLKVD